jgi:hypothetical protein
MAEVLCQYTFHQGLLRVNWRVFDGMHINYEWSYQ